jgi:hypothetical protein
MGGGWLTSRPGRFNHGNDQVPAYEELCGSQDRCDRCGKCRPYGSARCESQYRLTYVGPPSSCVYVVLTLVGFRESLSFMQHADSVQLSFTSLTYMSIPRHIANRLLTRNEKIKNFNNRCTIERIKRVTECII